MTQEDLQNWYNRKQQLTKIASKRVTDVMDHFMLELPMNLTMARTGETTINLDDYIANIMYHHGHDEKIETLVDYKLNAQIFASQMFVDQLEANKFVFEQHFISNDKTEIPEIADNNVLKEKLNEVINEVRNIDTDKILFIAYKKNGADYLYLNWSSSMTK